MNEVKNLKEKLNKTFEGEDLKDTLCALEVANDAHFGQKRKSGEDYIIHPCCVADILLNLGFDAKTIQAALLHDVIEDTSLTNEDIKEKFGDIVQLLVEGVTKLDHLQFNSKEEEQAENLRKMFFAIAKDIRVLIIKLADRLHNMRTVEYLDEDKRIKFAHETLEIYAPLASRLGISSIKCELEDLSMRYIYPQEYQLIKDDINLKQAERTEVVNKVCEEIKEKLKLLGLEGQVFGRAKHFYSIYKKMKKQNKTIDQIYDLMAVRVIVDSVKDCYTVLGTIHTQWKPMPGRFKDYIAMPKANMYQSLHTTVITNFGATCEIQIRTHEMHKIAEYGVAAHWKYKEGRQKTNGTDMDEKLSWLREFIDEQKENEDNSTFLDSLKINVFNDEVFVFTPRGDVHNLPAGSSPIDFAYNIHSAIGNKCIGAKVNNKIVPLNTQLKTGDIVEILTSKNTKGPSRDWLKIVKSAGAKNKIRQYFKHEEKDENIKRGKEMLEREAKHRGYVLGDLMSSKSWKKYLSKKFSIDKTEDLYNAVGYGGFTTNQVLLKLIEFFQKEVQTKETEPLITEKNQNTEKNNNTKHNGGVIIRGFDDFAVRLSHCCNPVPGDKIVGYVSRGRGVTVHCVNCPNVKNMEPERLIEASWDVDINQKFTAALKITAENLSNILANVTLMISKLNVPITGASAKIDKDFIANIIVIVEVNSIDDVDMLINRIKQVEGVIDVERASNNVKL